MVPAACGSTGRSVSDSRSGKLGVSFRRLESEAVRPLCMLGGASGVPPVCIRLAPMPMANRAASPPPTPTSFGLPAAPPSTAIQHHQAQGRRWALAPLGLAFTIWPAAVGDEATLHTPVRYQLAKPCRVGMHRGAAQSC